MTDALQLLRDDHGKVKDLFKDFENAEDGDTRKRIADAAIRELEVHTQIEEEIFYPVVRRQQGDTSEMMNEAIEEHHVVDLLIEELRDMPGSHKQFAAKFTVLAENVKHHIQEEESEMLPKAAELGADRLGPLGEQMERRKMELMAQPQVRSRKATPARKSATRKKASGRKTAARKPATGRKTAARKPATARKSTARKGSARQTGTGRKTTTTTRRTTTTTRRTTARKAPAGRKTTTAAARRTTGRAAATRSTARKTVRAAATRTTRAVTARAGARARARASR